MKLRNVGSNMTEITTEKGQILFSYETPVAALLADADNNALVGYRWQWQQVIGRRDGQCLAHEQSVCNVGIGLLDPGVMETDGTPSRQMFPRSIEIASRKG